MIVDYKICTRFSSRAWMLNSLHWNESHALRSNYCYIVRSSVCSKKRFSTFGSTNFVLEKTHAWRFCPCRENQFRTNFSEIISISFWTKTGFFRTCLVRRSCIRTATASNVIYHSEFVTDTSAVDETMEKILNIMMLQSIREPISSLRVRLCRLGMDWMVAQW